MPPLTSVTDNIYISRQFQAYLKDIKHVSLPFAIKIKSKNKRDVCGITAQKHL